MAQRYKVIPAGTIQGFLVSTGKSRTDGRRRLWQFRCLVCGTGYVWKRASSTHGVSCGCLRSHFSSMWIKICQQYIDREEAKAEYLDARQRTLSGMKMILDEDIAAGKDLLRPVRKKRKKRAKKS